MSVCSAQRKRALEERDEVFCSTPIHCWLLLCRPFYSQTAITNAIGNRPVLTDSFADGKSNIPGVSVSSITDFGGTITPGNGHFAPGMYVDFQSHYTSTTWIFNTPIYAFGGDWNMPMTWPGSSGEGGGAGVWNGLTVLLGNVDYSNPGQVDYGGPVFQMPDGVVPPWSSYANPPAWPSSAFSGFWGITSDRPFTALNIQVGTKDLSFRDILRSTTNLRICR